MSGLKKGDVAAMIRQHLKPGQTAIDVGASDGHLSHVMRECVGPTGHVVAFEPRTPMDKDIPSATLIRSAVGAQAGTATLYIGEPPMTSSLWSSAIKTRAGTRTLTVPVVRLDDLVHHADLVKVDVQGGEMAVLAGAPLLLQTCNVWILECWPWGLMKAGAHPLALFDRVTGAGLTVEGVTREDLIAWVGKAGENHYVNLVCVR